MIMTGESLTESMFSEKLNYVNISFPLLMNCFSSEEAIKWYPRINLQTLVCSGLLLLDLAMS